MRGSVLTMANIGGSSIMRLASNLLLTRLLFPEAFGLMALVQIVTHGLKMISDTGVVHSIVRSENGDKPEFLNTAWTVQICRGGILFVLVCLMAWPMAQLYDEPLLAQLLPVAAISTLIQGFRSTKVATAKRHLAFGRLTVINLLTQASGIIVMVFLAWLLQSVWAIAIGGVINALVTVLSQHRFLPGIRNHILWNKEAFSEIFNFGKFIFLSSILGFIAGYADKMILGAYLTMSDFGVFNIGLMIAMLPFAIGKAVNNSIVFPLYRQRPIAESPENKRKVFGARRLVIGATLTMICGLALIGVPVIDILYDPRYAMAGPVVVLMCLALVPQVVMESYRSVLMAAGDTRALFILVLATVILQVSLLLVAVQWFGTFGVIVTPALVHLLLMPLRVRLLKPHDGWDPVADMCFNGAGLGLTGLACWIYWDKVALLIS